MSRASMTDPKARLATPTLVEEESALSVDELRRSCRCSVELLVSLVDEGVLEPQQGTDPSGWRFSGSSLRRARVAVRLARDLELNPPGVALALDLLDELQRLKRTLR